jgi:hypothetical protein
MTTAQRAAKQQALKAAMSGLVLDERFGEFIDLLRDQKDTVVADACLDAVVKCPRASMAAIGEIRAYNTIISTYEDFLDRAAEPIQEQALQ